MSYREFKLNFECVPVEVIGDHGNEPGEDEYFVTEFVIVKGVDVITLMSDDKLDRLNAECLKLCQPKEFGYARDICRHAPSAIESKGLAADYAAGRMRSPA